MIILTGYWNFYASNEQSSHLLLIKLARAPEESQRREPLESFVRKARTSDNYTAYYEGYLDTVPLELELDTLTGHVVMLVGPTGPYRETKRTTTIYIGTVMRANQQVIAGTFDSSTIQLVDAVCRGLSTPPLQYWSATFQGPEIPPEPTESAQAQ
jgi:hypothetical protein